MIFGTIVHQFKVAIPVCQSVDRRRTFVVLVASVWNSLPFRVVGAGSIEWLKRILDVILGSKLIDTI